MRFTHLDNFTQVNQRTIQLATKRTELNLRLARCNRWRTEAKKFKVNTVVVFPRHLNKCASLRTRMLVRSTRRHLPNNRLLNRLSPRNSFLFKHKVVNRHLCASFRTKSKPRLRDFKSSKLTRNYAKGAFLTQTHNMPFQSLKRCLERLVRVRETFLVYRSKPSRKLRIIKDSSQLKSKTWFMRNSVLRRLSKRTNISVKSSTMQPPN